MSRYDLAVTHDWEYDADFVRLVEEAARARGLTPLLIPPADVARTLEEFREGGLDFGVLLDRGAGASPDFVALQALARERGLNVVDGLDQLRWASDKATMHLELLSAGVRTPYTLILPAFAVQPEVSLTAGDRAPLGVPFVIKPANTTGGSLGVIADAGGIDDVLAARRTYPADKYLLQEKIVPLVRSGAGLPARAVGAHRAPAMPSLRPASRAPVGRGDQRAAARAAEGRALPAARAARRQPQGRAPRSARRRRGRGLRALPYRRRDRARRRAAGARQEEEDTIDVVVDRLVVPEAADAGFATRLADSVETALKQGQGLLIADFGGGDERLYSEQLHCHVCDLRFPELSPQSLSFYSPLGMRWRCRSR